MHLHPEDAAGPKLIDGGISGCVPRTSSLKWPLNSHFPPHFPHNSSHITSHLEVLGQAHVRGRQLLVHLHPEHAARPNLVDVALKHAYRQVGFSA